MPRKPGKVPNYCHHKASGKEVVRIGGRDQYLGPYGSSESHAAYERVLAEWRVTALFLAAKHGHAKVCEVLLDAGADPSIRSEMPTRNEMTASPLAIAAGKGHVEVVELLLQRHPDYTPADREETSSITRGDGGR